MVRVLHIECSGWSGVSVFMGGVQGVAAVQTCRPHFHSGGIPKYVYIIFFELLKNYEIWLSFF